MTQPLFNILRTSHVEYYVTDLEKARAFYVDGVGFTETERDDQHIYLRGLEDRTHHCLVLTLHDRPGVSHVGFRVESEEDLTLLEHVARDEGLYYRYQERPEKGLGRTLRVTDPFGFPVEFFHQTDAAPWALQRFETYHGAEVMRLDHVNYSTPKIQQAYEWYTTRLGFRLSEYTVSAEGGKDRVWGAWMGRKQTSHDLAISNGVGPRFHHASFISPSKESLLHVADVLAATGYFENLERGPGRHGTTNAFFLYLRDPDGNRIELFTGDYLLAEPDWQPVKWDLNDPRRATFWGAQAPTRWFNETMDAYDWETSEPAPVDQPTLPDRPDDVPVSS